MDQMLDFTTVVFRWNRAVSHALWERWELLPGLWVVADERSQKEEPKHHAHRWERKFTVSHTPLRLNTNLRRKQKYKVQRKTEMTFSCVFHSATVRLPVQAHLSFYLLCISVVQYWPALSHITEIPHILCIVYTEEIWNEMSRADNVTGTKRVLYCDIIIFL